tara:strand:- start:6699 stop:8525 length:1827 start_codon:yes stop_codon:yes gene_type:complete
MSHLLLKIKTILALSLPNLIRVFFYRFGVRFGFNPVKTISANTSTGCFFNSSFSVQKIKLQANDQWRSQQFYFGWYKVATDKTPNWHRNILTDVAVKNASLPWWEISDFDAELGDVKTVWEASRLDWVLCFAQYAKQGDEQHLNKLNDWLNDWSQKNPPYLGANWKCGQEASIRVMHLAMTAVILEQTDNSELVLLEFIETHLNRIAPTVSYAIAQDNNHGTSEASALYIGGSWLANNGIAEGVKWQKIGLKWLENRAQKLILSDGSFSQYSTNYHRVMLDSYSMVEVWRKKLNLSSFSPDLYKKLQLATNWLYQFTQEKTGDIANLGANDGARLLPLTATDYRDFRPSVQLASVLFYKQKAWSNDGDWNLPLYWLGIALPTKKLLPQRSFDFNQGGYFGLRAKSNKAFVMMTYPKFKFRPSQCDALHVDFWLDGKNLLRDGGTFSYNAGDKYIKYYGGTESHNTIQFDQCEQMPRLSRFLLGAWIKAKNIFFDNHANTCQASYTDLHKNKHLRTITLNDKVFLVEDTISGFKKSAVLRWRLQPGDWKVEGHSLVNSEHLITVRTDMPIIRFELIQGTEARYYYHESNIPVLEIEFQQAGTIITEYKY